MCPSGVMSRLRMILEIYDRKRKRADDDPTASIGGGGSSAVAPAYRRTPTILNLFVRTISGNTVLIHANPGDTVDSFIQLIEVSTMTKMENHSLLFHGREIESGRGLTLANFGLNSDSYVRLVGRMLSTDYLAAREIVKDLIFSLCSDSPNANSILSLLKTFVTMLAGKMDMDFWGNLQVFLQSRAPTALINLYLSPENSKVALNTIRLLLLPGSGYFPTNVRRRCGAHILFEFCRLLRGSVGIDDPLYLYCRSMLASVLENGGSMYMEDPHFEFSDVMQCLLPFVEELMGLIVKGLKEEEPLINSAGLLSEARHYVVAMQQVIHKCMSEPGPKPKWMFLDTSLQFESCLPSLHAIFLKLLMGVKCWLSNVAGLLERKCMDESRLKKGSRALHVLSLLNSFSNICGRNDELLRNVLLDQRVPLNALLKHAERSNSFYWILKHKDIITDFETRRNLILMLFPVVRNEFDEQYEVFIDRSQLLVESFAFISEADAIELHGGITVVFKNEVATGLGVLREWFYLLCQAIFNPQEALFVSCPNDPRRFYPNPTSNVDPLHLQYFDFCGRVIALTLMNNVQVGIVFDRVFFLLISGEKVTLEDIQVTDPTFYTSCKEIMGIDAEVLDTDKLGLTFVREIEEMGSRRSIELCPGGKDIVVNSKNRSKYIDLLVKDKFVTSICQQVSHFAHGFSEILHTSGHMKLFFQSLDLEDFDKMLGGSDPVISVKEWKKHTKYKGYKAKDHQICWFWEIVEEMSVERRLILLYFWTSVKYLPIDGFGGLASKLKIIRINVSDDHLPTSHTCFLQLCLPPYPSMSVMRQRLEFITHEHVSSSFGIS